MNDIYTILSVMQKKIAVVTAVVLLMVGGLVYFATEKYFEYRAQRQEIAGAQQRALEETRQEIERLKTENTSTKSQLKKIQEASLKRLSNKEIINKVKPAVVYIEATNNIGSGMILSEDGFILTNAHVVFGVHTAVVKLSDKRILVASVVGRDENIDLAVLKINGNGFASVELGNSDIVEQGDEVFTLGYPLGIEGNVSFKEGTISRILAENGITYLETSADVLPGNSGGPLVNKFGQVVGINTFVISEAQIKGVSLGETLKFATSINSVKSFIAVLKSGSVVLKSEIQKSASGIITVFNISSGDQTLVKFTRFMASNGLIYRIQETIVIPARSRKDVEILANGNGYEYELNCSKTEPCLFTIPGFKGTRKYDLIFGNAVSQIKLAKWIAK